MTGKVGECGQLIEMGVRRWVDFGRKLTLGLGLGTSLLCAISILPTLLDRGVVGGLALIFYDLLLLFCSEDRKSVV